MSSPHSAMILAAGRGERMRPLTDECPKPMLQVVGRPLIAHHLEHLARSGFRRVVINLGWLGTRIREWVGDGSRFGLEVVYSPEGWPALDTGGGIARALPHLGPDPFLVINGDVWTDCRLDGLTLDEGDLARLVVVANPAHRPDGDFLFRAGRLDPEWGDPVTFAGIGVYHPQLFSGREGEVAGERFALGPLLRRAIASGQVSATFHDGEWRDIGTPERLHELDARLRGP